MKLWHDDVRPPPEPGWVWARTNEEAMANLATGAVTECSLDHDMGLHEVEVPEQVESWDEIMDIVQMRGGATETGYDLVNWMIAHDCVPKKVTIHSWNPEGAKNMAARLNYHGYDCVVRPFVIPT